VTYLPFIRADLSNHPTMQVSQFLKRETPRHSAILVLGSDWSSEIPYYSERKAIALAGWIPPAKFEAVLSAPDSFLGALPLSAVVYCRDSTPEQQRRPADALLARLPIRRPERIAGCDVYLIGSQ
jgi:hypothetical protein